jgi:hypothetical protein
MFIFLSFETIKQAKLFFLVGISENNARALSGAVLKIAVCWLLIRGDARVLATEDRKNFH